MSDDLDSLTGEKLSEVFAEKVAGWTNIGDCSCGDHKRGTPPKGGSARHVPNFATSADALLPYLQKCEDIDARFCPQIGHRWQVTVFRPGVVANGSASEFARAAALALIRAERHLTQHGKQS